MCIVTFLEATRMAYTTRPAKVSKVKVTVNKLNGRARCISFYANGSKAKRAMNKLDRAMHTNSLHNTTVKVTLVKVTVVH